MHSKNCQGSVNMVGVSALPIQERIKYSLYIYVTNNIQLMIQFYKRT